ILVDSAHPHPVPLTAYLGTLAGGLGCFPLDYESYHPFSDSQPDVTGIRSLTEFGNPMRAPRPISALPPGRSGLRLALKLFRREPAISVFDWLFTPTHTSSPHFSAYVGSGLQSVLPDLHPVHVSLTRFPVDDRILNPAVHTRFRCGFVF